MCVYICIYIYTYVCMYMYMYMYVRRSRVQWSACNDVMQCTLVCAMVWMQWYDAAMRAVVWCIGVKMWQRGKPSLAARVYDWRKPHEADDRKERGGEEAGVSPVCPSASLQWKAIVFHIVAAAPQANAGSKPSCVTATAGKSPNARVHINIVMQTCYNFLQPKKYQKNVIVCDLRPCWRPWSENVTFL